MTAPLVAVVDHGAGNLVSIAQGLERAGATVRVAAGPAGLTGCDGVVLPGVGATAAAMERLRSARMVEPLRGWDGPMLGICVGLQLLFERSEEDGADCLGILPGEVRRLKARRLPHIGWNDILVEKPDPLFDGLRDGALGYFVHSYAAMPDDPAVVVASAEYDAPFVAAVRWGEVCGVQFHPERSAATGLRILANFVDSIRCGVTAGAMAAFGDVRTGM
ncbi:MAG TPA: imidazole glycerol phosphate synthase subunit HisH [Acidimicrobiia bacterium]|nr:imidazole glycerol phosphate synthase subunit HisH [Acidimicrobiia bacterium]